MALEPRGCPVLYGETAERFVREAEEALKSDRYDEGTITHEDIERIKKNTEEFLAKHGGSLKNVKFG
jgi:aminoglycoside phosphotransferase family enzyme